MTRQATATTRKPVSWHAYVLVGGVFALGLLVRAYHYNEESVCLEEWVGFKYLDAPNLFAYLTQTRDLYRTMAPVYYAVVYLWACVFGPGVGSIRLISVFSGALAVPMLYLFTWHFFGRSALARRAALLAMLCAALSPMHVFHSQEARPYAFFVLAAAVSAYTLLRATRSEGWCWWLANIGANLVVAFTHPFGIFLPFAEGLYILLAMVRRREFLREGVWIVCHTAMAGLALGWFLTMSHEAWDPHYVFGPYVPVLTPHRLFCDVVGDDIPGLSTEFAPSGQTWPFLPPAFMKAVQTPLRRVLIPLELMAIAWNLWAVVRTWPRPRTEPQAPPGAETPPAEDRFFLLLWLLIPPLVLAIISIFNPCHMPRYTVYASLALYVMIGGAVAAIPWRALRIAGAAVFTVLFGYFVSIGVPGLNNVDWRSMVKRVESSSPDDFILTHGTDYLNILLFHMGGHPRNPYASTSSREGLCDLIDFTFQIRPPEKDNPAKRHAVWALIIRDNGPEIDFENTLRMHDLDFERTDFPGLRYFIVYRVTRSTPSAPAKPLFSPVLHYAEAMAQHVDSPSFKAFERQTSWDLDSWGGPFLRLGLVFAARQEIGDAAACFSKALEYHPQYVTEFVNMQRELGSYVLDDAIVPALRKGVANEAPECKWWLPSAYGMIGEIMLEQSRFDDAEAALKRTLEIDPGVGYAYGMLAAAQTAKGRDAEAEANVKRFLELDPHAHKMIPFFEALYAKHYDAAWEQLRVLGIATCGIPMPFLRKLEKESNRPLVLPPEMHGP